MQCDGNRNGDENNVNDTDAGSTPGIPGKILSFVLPKRASIRRMQRKGKELYMNTKNKRWFIELLRTNRKNRELKIDLSFKDDGTDLSNQSAEMEKRNDRKTNV